MTSTRTFELRTYRSSPGRLAALSARFRDHTMALFAAHEITVEGFWQAQDLDDPSTGSLVYICSFPSREAAAASWESFRDDPEWQLVKGASEVHGSLTSSVESLFMAPTDYSPMR
jgi:hypothetical protein